MDVFVLMHCHGVVVKQYASLENFGTPVDIT